MQRSVTVIGPGNWGSSLAHALRAAGIPLQEIIVRPGKRNNAGWTRGWPITPLEGATLNADIFWLCVPDAAIPAVVRKLVQRAASLQISLKRRIVVHSSGALGADALEPAKGAGAGIASVHPLMSFPSRRPVPLQAVPFGIEASAAVRSTLYKLVRQLGGRPFTIPPGSKALYHAMGVLSSPLLVSHLAAVHQVALLAGFSPRLTRQLIEPILRATLDNVFQQGLDQQGLEGSFSGPIARGDTATIRLHLQALQSHPMVADVYSSLARYANEALPSPGKKEMRRLLRPR